MVATLVQTVAAPDPFADAEAQFQELVTHLRSEETREMTHSELERDLQVRSRELMRLLYQAHLDTRGEGEAIEKVEDVEGMERTRTRMHDRGLATVFGTVTVSRLGYGAEGEESLHPLDAELNLPVERYSHELRRQVATESAKNSFDETVESIASHTGTEIHKRQVEELASRAALDFDAFYKERQATARERAMTREGTGSVLVLSADGKGVVMRHEDLREATRKAAEKKRHKLQKRLSKGEKRNAKRMATVATVYTIAPFERTPEEVVRKLAPVHEVEKTRRPRPEDKRVWASLEKTPEQVIGEAFREAKHRDRDPKHAKTWVALVDGNKTQLEILNKLSGQHGVKLTVVLDLIHVLEYLWKAAHVFEAEATPELEAWVSKRLLEILRGRSSHVAAGIRRSATLRELTDEQRKPADRCADYLLGYRPYLRYDEYLAKGLPIATGVIEGACRHLVKDRMDLTGARWSLTGAEAVLRLRALRSSGDFEAYWIFHEAREQQRNHAARYANGTVPRTKSPVSKRKKPRLTIVD